MSRSKQSAALSSFEICDKVVMTTIFWERYLHIKYNETYMKVAQLLEFNPWLKSPFITGDHMFSICDKQCLQWLVMGIITVRPCPTSVLMYMGLEWR